MPLQHFSEPVGPHAEFLAVFVPPWQAPFRHVWLVMQVLVLHVVPFCAFCVTQLPVAGLQTLALHGSVLAGQVFAVPPWQVPLWHVCPVLQRSVLHVVPFTAFCVTQLPVAGLQTLTLHGSVLAGQVFCGPP